MTTIDKIKIPFSYFGGKRRVAPIVWQRFGKVSNYVEPFAGSLSVLLSNPNIPKIETVNEINPFIVNFWRSVSFAPQEVAKYADYPVSEIDLHARQKYLLSKKDLYLSLENDISYFDAEIAGLWIYGQSLSVGDNWLKPKGEKAMPVLSSAGSGIIGLTYDIEEEFSKLCSRLKKVRIICGDWKRVVSPAITYNNVGLGNKDITSIFLDPPYDLSNRDKVYDNDKPIYYDVCRWAIDNGNNCKMRIAVCGYENDFIFPENWQVFAWEANGGMANLGESNGRKNKSRERIYFSPHCLKLSQ
jgi:DNA adenine methylase